VQLELAQPVSHAVFTAGGIGTGLDSLNIASSAKIRLYELVLDNGRSSSPYVWRIRYALAHKGLSYESVPIGFTEIPTVFGGRFKTVPVIEHGQTMLGESWDIAEYLDRAFPTQPALFSGPSENAMVRLIDAWFYAEILRKLFRIYILDVHHAARAEDRAYFRQSREAMLHGKTLEALTADRVSRLPALREALSPLRVQLSRSPYLGGSTPNYADYIALGAFHWVASVSTLPALAANDDVIRAWLDRGFDLYEGLGRDPKMKSLFE
jgi:glutathione S-transferase